MNVRKEASNGLSEYELHQLAEFQRIESLYPPLKNGAPPGKVWEALRKRTSGSMERVLAEPIPEDLK